MSVDYGLESFGKALVPKKFRPNLRSYLMKAGIYEIPYAMYGGLFFLSAAVTGLIYFLWIFPFLADKSTITVLLGTFIIWALLNIVLAFVVISSIYFFLDIRIFNRTKRIEEILPDFLEVISSNLKAGMTFEKALWASIHPRFGILSDEVAIAAKKVMTGAELEEALTEFMNKYDSPILRRSMEIILGEIEGGGKIADIIDEVVLNLKQTRELKEELTAAVLSYVIFITLLVIFIAPALFALSYNLLAIITGLSSKLSSANLSTTGISVPINFSNFSIDVTLFKQFSYASISIIAVFSSMIVSMIQKGNIKGGVKFIPIFLVSSIFMYFLFMQVLSAMFSGALV